MTALRLFALSALLSSAALTCSALPAPHLPATPAAVTDDTTGVSSQFTLSGQTEIPGKTLKPGAYTIRIVDHLSDRMIVEVSRDGKSQARFLALPASHLPKPGSPGPISVNGGTHGQGAMRGFAFPNGTLAEFVYPKAEAVGIAKANSTTIPAIDPASEGIPEAKQLSPKDLQLVTLWMLTPTTVGPNDEPAVSAARYQAPQAGAGEQQVAASPAVERQTTYQAAVKAPVPPSNRSAGVSRRRTASSQTAGRTSGNNQVDSGQIDNSQVASNQIPTRPVRVQPQALRATGSLPHTASDLPLAGMAGAVATLGALLLARRRRGLTARA